MCHGTETHVMAVKKGQRLYITERQMKDAERRLCGDRGCWCQGIREVDQTIYVAETVEPLSVVFYHFEATEEGS